MYDRSDRANTVIERRDAVDSIIEFYPYIMKIRASSQVLRRHVIPKNWERVILKPKFQKSQAMSAENNSITLGQQFCWYTLVEKTFNNLQDKSTGRCKKTRKTFGEVVPFFVLGLDDMCIMLDSCSDSKVIVLADKKKHEEMMAGWYVIFFCISNVQTCVSISFDLNIMLHSLCILTIIQTVCGGGVTGPTIFLMKGN